MGFVPTSSAAVGGEGQPFSLRSAVKPMPRRLGAGGCMSSRMAERMALIASSWCWYLRSSSSSLRASAGVGGEQFAHAHEGAHDLDVDGDGSFAAEDGGERRDALLGEGVGCPSAYTRNLSLTHAWRKEWFPWSSYESKICRILFVSEDCRLEHSVRACP